MNVFTGIGFASVIVAIGLSSLVASARFQTAYALERAALFTTIGLCVVAILVARVGSVRTAVPIVVSAAIVAMNAIGTLFSQ